MKIILTSIFIITISVLFVQCSKETPTDQGSTNSKIDQEDFLVLETTTNNIIAYNSATLNYKTVGSIPELENIIIDARISIHSNMFVDRDRNQLIASGKNVESELEYILVFNYSTAKLIDSIKIEYPFTNKFFYSKEGRSIVSFVHNTVYAKTLSDGNTETYLAPIEACGWEHQGIDNEGNLFYNYGCNITTIFDLKSKEFNVIDNKEVPDKWSGLFSIGFNQDENYLIGHGLFQRHFPEDPDFIGTYDSIRNELYLVKKEIYKPSFEEVRVTTKYGLNNGYYDVSKALYFLHQEENNSIKMFDKDLKITNTIEVKNQYLIKQ